MKARDWGWLMLGLLIGSGLGWIYAAEILT